MILSERYSGSTDQEVSNKNCSKANRQQKASFISVCLSFSWNHFASPLSIRAVGCSLPRAPLDQRLWCRPAPGRHGRLTASGQQQSQYTQGLWFTWTQTPWRIADSVGNAGCPHGQNQAHYWVHIKLMNVAECWMKINELWEIKHFQKLILIIVKWLPVDKLEL